MRRRRLAAVDDLQVVDAADGQAAIGKRVNSTCEAVAVMPLL